ncbi:MAG: HD domain-containing protein [Candidatus Staskawiczbacteria bacterium]|nr:HD domain-containing protein [Candidatus Staskawiczbacteria bacterium]
MITLNDVKNSPQVVNFINQTERAMTALHYTNHGLRHTNLVAERASQIAKGIGLSQREAELASIAGFCHDMGNFMTRTFHHYYAALLFHQIFQHEFEPEEISTVMQAIANHDKEEMNFSHSVSSVLVLADKSDVNRTRVTEKDINKIKLDIHDKVNYATTESNLKIDKTKKRITLTLKIDTNFCPIMEYFEIFTERMVFCRKAAEFLGYEFGLVINKFRLL